MTLLSRLYLFCVCYGPRWSLRLFPARWKAQAFQTVLRRKVAR